MKKNKFEITKPVMEQHFQKVKDLKKIKADDITIEQHEKYAEILDEVENNLDDNILSIENNGGKAVEWRKARNDVKKLRIHLDDIYEIEHHLQVNTPYHKWLSGGKKP